MCAQKTLIVNRLVGGKKMKKMETSKPMESQIHVIYILTYLKYGKILFRGKIVWATYLHDLLARCFCCFLLLTGFVCLVHISDVIFDANQSREYKCSLFSSEISRSCLHWRHHLLFPFLASPNLCGSRCSSIDSFQIIISCCKFKYRGPLLVLFQGFLFM